MFCEPIVAPAPPPPPTLRPETCDRAGAAEPCGDGWDSDNHDDGSSGWLGVVCNSRGGRVVWVRLISAGLGGELLPFFGRLGALLYLTLNNNPALRGDVADLAGATELRSLDLSGCSLVATW